MTDSTPAALVFVAETGLADLRFYLKNLEIAPSKVVPTILKQIKEVADVLSMSLDKLSAYCDVLEGEGITPDAAPESDRGLLLAALELGRAAEHGFCPKCGGVRHG